MILFFLIADSGFDAFVSATPAPSTGNGTPTATQADVKAEADFFNQVVLAKIRPGASAL